MAEHHLTFNFKARYFTSGEITSTTKHVLFVLHGYGQLAPYFIRKFSTLENKDVVVIAPEGLSRFYIDPLEGPGRKTTRVGATWMTKEDRLTDIENYISYLDTVFAQTVGSRKIPVSVLGFSQGSATASRWILSRNIHFDRLILWAGILPEDMNVEVGAEVLKDKSVVMVYGKQDPFLTDARFNEMKLLVEKLKTNVDIVTFEGGHDIDEHTLSGLFS
ncbi:MAG TPA: alpha/beta hydrolase [Chryseosolibacter sp.]